MAARSCTTQHNGADADIHIAAKVEVDVRHDQLDADWEHGAVNIRVEGLGVIEEQHMFTTGTLCRGGPRCSASHTCD